MVVKGLAEWISWNSAASRTNLRIQSCKCFLKTRCMDVSSSENRSSMCCPLTKIGVEEAHIVWQSLRVAMAIAPLKGPTKKAALLPCIISLVCRIESRDELIKEIKPAEFRWRKKIFLINSRSAWNPHRSPQAAAEVQLTSGRPARLNLAGS